MKKYTQKELDGMNEWQILYLLQKQPQLIHKVNIRKMG